MLIGALLPCVLDGLHVAPELWAAVFITLSLCAYDRDRPLLGVLLGVTALFFRDLAGLYCLVMGLMALASRRWLEVLAWFGGLLAYAAFFAWHAANVFPLIGPNDLAHRGSWLQLGGLPFVLSTCQMNVFLLALASMGDRVLLHHGAGRPGRMAIADRTAHRHCAVRLSGAVRCRRASV